MSHNSKVLKYFLCFVFTCSGLSRVVLLHAYTASDFNAVPPFVTASAPPLVMLVMERDDKLYYPAYDDASDLKGGNDLDLYYKPGKNDYYGYFDSYKCYTYNAGYNTPNTGEGRFEPVRVTTDKKCNTSGHSNEWSGDWLNYVTTSRMDAMRKVLYGGYRSVDSTTETVLRRTYIPQDAHTWGKSYESEANDHYKISDYTPLTAPDSGKRHLFANTTLSDNGNPLVRVLPNSPYHIWDWVAKERPEGDDSLVSGSGNYDSYPNNVAEFAVLVTTYATAQHFLGQNNPVQINGSGNPFPNSHDPGGLNNSDYYLDVFTGTITVSTTGDYYIACDGDDAVEVLIDGAWVTGWYGGHGNDAGTAQNNYAAQVHLTAGIHSVVFHHQERQGGDNYYLYWNGPDSGNNWQLVPALNLGSGLSNLTHSFYDVYNGSTITDLTVQVKVCDPTVVNGKSLLESNCKLYSNGTTYKPTGLLQTHGESDSMYFGLLTGSYMKNLSGGVLRKNVGSIKDEIDPVTGKFTTVNGIIQTINKIRVIDYGYPAEGVQYYYWNNCGWITDRPINEGECRMWGNPVGEMMYETLRYFSGAKTQPTDTKPGPTTSFTYDYTDGNADDNRLGLPHPDWKDPYDKTTGGFDRCSKPFMLVISDVTPGYDSDSIPGADPNFGSISQVAVGNTTDKLNAKDLANFISTNEGITSGPYYIGQVANQYDSVCSAKSIPSGLGLGDIRGLCPEEPTKMGSYYSAAVAYYGRTHDISSTADDNQYLTTYAVALASPMPKMVISVGTSTITLVPFGKSVGGCYYINIAEGAYQPTESIASFFVQTLTPTHGIFRVNFEDVEQGSDHDMDAIVLYEYQVVDQYGTAVTDPKDGTQVKITLASDYAAGCIIQHMGYVISGTSADGAYLDVRDSDTDPSTDPDYFLDTPPGKLPHSASDWKDGVALPLVATRFFSPAGTGNAPAQILKDPLWYAAKWGGFQTNNAVTSTYVPSLDEWNSSGNGAPDNRVPDTYFPVTNPLTLQQQLSKSFADILRRASSGTAASVISNSRSGEGAVYQSIFYPTNTDDLSNNITWVGDVESLFVDVNGNLREDTNHDHILNIIKNTDPTDKKTQCGDLIVKYESTTTGTTVKKYADCNGSSVLDTTQLVSTGNMNSVEYLWQAGNWLNSPSLDPVTQRVTYAPASASDIDMERRYIFTFIDNNKNMVPDTDEIKDFSCPTLPLLPDVSDLTDTSKVYPYLNVYPPFEASAPSYIESLRPPKTWDTTCSSPNESDVKTAAFTDFLRNQTCRVINYIRGQDQSSYNSVDWNYNTVSNSCNINNPAKVNYSIPAFRSRQFDYFRDKTNVTWRLGDIVYSTPTVVSRPSEGYHLLYQDSSYADFVDHYLNRRSVVYVGANDGMVHAFNAGFYDDAARQFNLQPSGGGGAPFPLGAELWAYVPYNLLPHLLWLTDPSYGHVYYVDEKPRIFDARIFNTDADHPNGWGTVMVIGMRFGGGTVCADMDKVNSTESSRGLSMTTCNSSDRLMSSAFIVMDITNPETPPRLLAELTFPGLGYTTCYPTAIPMGESGGSTLQNDWYLVFGSGPAEQNGTAGPTVTDGSRVSLTQAASQQSAKLYMVDLKALAGSFPEVRTLDSTTKQFQVSPSSGNRYWQALDTNAFISDPITVDYQLDYKADAVYFGTVSGNETNGWTGKFRRIVINNDTNVGNWVGDSILLDDEFSLGYRQPITAAPTASTDTVGNRWVFFGTGRFLVKEDKYNLDQQSYYGIIDPVDSNGLLTGAPIKRADLFPVKGAIVNSDKSVTNLTGITDWSHLVGSTGSHGWKFDFPSPSGDNGAERNVGQAALLGSTLTFTTYIPSSDPCIIEGNSNLYGLYYTTGTEFYSPILKTAGGVNTPFLSLGLGLATTPNIHVGGEDGSKIFIQSSTGAINVQSEQNAGPTSSGMRYWRFYEP